MSHDNKEKAHNISISFGPKTGYPSFKWVAEDIATHLKKIGYNDTDTFENFASETRGNIIFIIKFLPSLEWIVKKKKDKKKLIFVPVDIFSSREEIHHKRSIISLFDTIVIHNETIREYLRPYAHAIFNVEHYLKFDIGDKRKYIEKGNILWIGQIEYIPALLETLKDNAFKYPIVALTNIFYFNKKQSETVAEIERRVGHCHITEKDGIIIINGLRLEQWTEKKQNLYMKQCKCAFDTKDSTFRHMIKPATKSQQFIFNRIPFAAPKNSYAYQLFLKMGLEIPSIEEQERWFSEEYYKEIVKISEKHKEALSIELVTREYISIAKKTQYHRIPVITSILIKLQVYELLQKIKNKSAKFL